MRATKRHQEEEITQRLDTALERLQASNARQRRAREKLSSVRQPGASEEEVDLDRALDAGSGPRAAVS
jgi:hypothetical protein